MRLIIWLALAALLLLAALITMYPSASGFDGRSLLAFGLALAVLVKLRNVAA